MCVIKIMLYLLIEAVMTKGSILAEDIKDKIFDWDLVF